VLHDVRSLTSEFDVVLERARLGKKQDQANLERTFIWAQNGALSTPLMWSSSAQLTAERAAFMGAPGGRRHALAPDGPAPLSSPRASSPGQWHEAPRS
jgi:hypothetical protein